MQRSNKGFTLMEVLLVMAVLSLIALSGLSNIVFDHYSALKQRESLKADATSLVDLIDRARSHSVNTGRPIYMCGGLECNGNWSERIFLADERSLSSIYVSASLSPSAVVVWRGFPVLRDYIAFLPTGLSAYQNGSFYLCEDGNQALRVVISQSGRAYLDSEQYEASECL